MNLGSEFHELRYFRDFRVMIEVWRIHPGYVFESGPSKKNGFKNRMRRSQNNFVAVRLNVLRDLRSVNQSGKQLIISGQLQ